VLEEVFDVRVEWKTKLTADAKDFKSSNQHKELLNFKTSKSIILSSRIASTSENTLGVKRKNKEKAATVDWRRRNSNEKFYPW
jgi:hypothetical protein